MDLNRGESFRSALKSQREKLQNRNSNNIAMGPIGSSKENTTSLTVPELPSSQTQPPIFTLSEPECSNSDGATTRESTPCSEEIRNINSIRRSTTPDSIVSPVPELLRKTPVPSDSPLLSPKPHNGNYKRVRSLSRKKIVDRDKSVSRMTPPGELEVIHYSEITFTIRKSKYGRKGWIITPDNDNIDIRRIKREIIEDVMSQIHALEFSGQVIPDKITMRN